MPWFATGEQRTMLVWGAVGGALPTLGKVAGTYGANFDAPTPNMPGVFIAIGLYAVIGSIISRAIGNPDVKQALFAGIAAPAIVVSVLAGATDSKSLHPPSQSTGGLFSAAFAQTSTASPDSSARRAVEVQTIVTGSYPVTGTIQVSSKTPGGALVHVGDVQVTSPNSKTSVSVPAGSTALVFTGPGGTQTTVPIGKNIQLQITPTTSVSKDLLWALGSQRSLDIGNMSASELPQR